MGRAIVRDPKCFLMDEPLSNLDAKLRVQMRTQVSRIQQRLRRRWSTSRTTRPRR
jgi:multiple sugar transport system ATP-binding protein